ncbi:flagellar assembly protein FliH [Paraburkholderia sp.]|uniref:flagellar assembly protein FliH n=1 Tax=Paraburkholderia sp. TaxID=1926495 RepID=UPI00238B4873|nr:flagellar assembly protein FliH [Paraburkholderia sp.]MDE1181214.1 flagellar assembly protein FliH [Paraburkholderia sp.]
MSNQTPARNANLSAYQRWEMASFDPKPPAPPPVPEVDHRAFEAELERLRDAAHAQGVAQGHVAGQALGYQAGYEQGHAQGFAQGQSEAREEAARLAALAATFQDALDGAQGEISETLFHLAIDIAQQVVRQHVQHDPTALIAVARDVLATEPALTGAPHLLVSPSDLPVVEAYLMEELQARGWTVGTDPAIERGGCRAQAHSGEVDAGIDTRWERVAAALGKVSKW